MKILVINPGSTSTKIAVYRFEKCVFQATIRHPDTEIARFKGILDQYQYRLQAVKKALADSGYDMAEFSAIAARGGLLRPLAGGTYLINEEMCNDLIECRYGGHVSNIAAIMAYNLGKTHNIPGYIVDPVTVDEFHDLARFSGLPELPRVSRSHFLNMRAVAREASLLTGISFNDIKLIVVHLGSGISVASFSGGKMIDVSDPNREGPFSIERCGAIPSLDLVALCYSGAYTEKEMKEKITRAGGIYAYLGTKDFSRVEAMIVGGDEQAGRVVRAMCYQVAKEIGAMSTVLYGKVDRIALTGGMSNSKLMVDEISARTRSIAEVLVIPGEREMEALALGVVRVCKGEEDLKNYGKLSGGNHD